MPPLNDVFPTDYDALVISGRRAPEYLRLNSEIIKIVQYFAQNQKPIAAICHGAQLLSAAEVLKGKHCSAYPAYRPAVAAAGGEYIDLAMDDAHIDGNLVTAPA